MAPVLMELQSRPDLFESVLVVTGQHRQMLDQMVRIFDLKPDYDLNVMTDRQTLSGLAARALTGLEPILEKEKPDIVLVHGDTSTSFIGALAGYYGRCPVGHVEAGLRTYDKFNPYPEEMNRQLIDYLADVHFTPTKKASDVIEKEGVAWRHIYQTGNTVVDAALWVSRKEWPEVEASLPAPTGRRTILVEAHRRENWGAPMQSICEGLLDIIEAKEDAEILFPVHLNPVVRDTVMPMLGNHERIRLIEPQDYVPFVLLMKRADLILTDSGGIQEEGPTLGAPVLVMREKTERPEAIAANTAKLVGADRERIRTTALELLNDDKKYNAMRSAQNPYGDGQAARRTVDGLEHFFGMRGDPPDAFNPEVEAE